MIEELIEQLRSHSKDPLGSDIERVCREAADALAAKDTALSEAEKNLQIAISMARLHEEIATETESALSEMRVELETIERAAKNYMRAVSRLGEQSGYNNLSFFEAPISKMPNDELGMEAVRRWQDLDATGKALNAVLAARALSSQADGEAK